MEQRVPLSAFFLPLWQVKALEFIQGVINGCQSTLPHPGASLMSGESPDTAFAFVFVAVVAFVASFIGHGVGHDAGLQDGKHAVHMEAVERGYGEWLASKGGDTTFVWKGEE